MKLLKISLVLFVFALIIFACSQTNTTNTNSSNSNVVASNKNTQPAPATDELASSKKIFTEKCAKCHKENGAGGITEIDGEKIKAPNFASDRMKNKDDAGLIKNIEMGMKEDGMPAFKGVLSDEEIKNLVKYIRRDFQGNSFLIQK